MLPEVWEDVIREVDLNGDGRVDFEEFKIMLVKLVDRTSEISS